jgi:hypothetical protein
MTDHPYSSDVEYWRHRAEKVRAQAMAFQDPEARQALLEISKTYETLARRHEETITKKKSEPR